MRRTICNPKNVYTYFGIYFDTHFRLKWPFWPRSSILGEPDHIYCATWIYDIPNRPLDKVHNWQPNNNVDTYFNCHFWNLMARLSLKYGIKWQVKVVYCIIFPEMNKYLLNLKIISRVTFKSILVITNPCWEREIILIPWTFYSNNIFFLPQDTLLPNISNCHGTATNYVLFTSDIETQPSCSKPKVLKFNSLT